MALALALVVERRGAAGRYRDSPSSIRASAALLAALIASGFVHLLLRGSPATRDDAAPRAASIVVVLPHEPPPRIAPTPAEPPRPAKPRAAASTTRTPQAAPTISEPVAPSAPLMEPRPAESPTAAAASASAPLDLSDRVIRSAVAQSKGAVRRQADAAGQDLDTSRPTRDQVFATATAEAGVPGCLRPDALKHDPPKIGPIPIPGIFAAPFVVHAAISGKCRP